MRTTRHFCFVILKNIGVGIWIPWENESFFNLIFQQLISPKLLTDRVVNTFVIGLLNYVKNLTFFEKCFGMLIFYMFVCFARIKT